MKRERLTKWLTSNGYLHSPIIKDAFLHINRADFVGDEHKDESRENLPVSIGFGKVVPQPSTTAFILELAEPKPGEKILHVGAGSGWITALLARIVCGKKDADTPSGKVIAIESNEELSNTATKNLEKYNFISNGIADVICGNEKGGFKNHAPYDKIISSVSFKEIPSEWKDEVRIGGRIIIPVGERIIVLDKTSSDSFSRKQYFGFDLVSGE
ncbi:MAG: protein-L-isoaspartate O-methyltransferase [bacterium]